MLKGIGTDIIGQYEAIEAVKESTNYSIITTLYEILKSQEVWFGVRKKAAKALASMS